MLGKGGQDVRLELNTEDLVQCAPLPDWVEHEPYCSELPNAEISCVANGVRRLLNDIQINLCGPEHAWHVRTVQSVLTREGAERVAHFVADFDPGYQRLDIHFVRVLRNGERIEHANRNAIQLLRRETNLERLTFDGRLSASLLIPDVRIGDRVEIGVTIYGSPKVLGGRFVAWTGFDSFNPYYEWRQRLLCPSARRILVKSYNNAPEAAVVEHAETRDMRWKMEGQKRRNAEPLTPPWVILHPTFQFSEFENWNEVTHLLAPHYEGDILADDLAVEVDRLGAAHQDPAERAVEWLRFVQRELRYFAFSLGEGGLTPRKLETVWRGRFGDCKDATALYVAGARRLGLEACAALVSTTHGIALGGFLPSSGVFDHCIVRLRHGGVSYWLDPTIPVQFGTLQSIFQPHIGWALPLDPDVVDLERLSGDAPLHVLHREDDITFASKRAAPATFRRMSEYSSWASDLIRNRIANEGTNGFAQALLREMQSLWPGIVETAPIEISDDKVRNRFKVVSSYEILDCWKPSSDGSRLSFPIVVGFGQELQVLPNERRETEIFVGRPRKMTSRVQINMPRSWGGGGWQHRFEKIPVAYVHDFRVDGRILADFQELRIEDWSVRPAEAEAYNEVAKKAQENLLTFAASERFGRIRPWVSNKARFYGALGSVIYFGGWLLFMLWLVWRSHR